MVFFVIRYISPSIWEIHSKLLNSFYVQVVFPDPAEYFKLFSLLWQLLDWE